MGQFGVCSTETKTAIIDGCMPGTLLEFPGHITMYLGEVDGKHYAISSVGSIMVRDGDELVFQPMNCVCITSLEDTFRRNGLNWLECMTH